MAANAITYNQTEGTMSQEYRVARDSMLAALYENAALILPFIWRKSLAGFHSTTERFTKKPKLVAASIADGVDLSNTPYTPRFTPLTVGEVGLKLEQTDLNKVSSLTEAAELGMEMGQAIAEKLLSDIASLGGGASNAVGSSGNNLTESQFLEGKAQLMLNRIAEPHVAVLYTQQAFDLMADIGTTLASLIGTGGGSIRGAGNDQTPNAGNDQGTWNNVRVITTTTVPTANAGADSAGFMFGSQRAIAMVEKWATRMENERDASLRASEYVGTSAYAVGEVDDDAIVGVITDR